MKPHLQTLLNRITNNDLPFAKTLTNDSLTLCMGSEYAIHVAIRRNHQEMVDIFLNINSALVNQIDGEGQSPLILAARSGHTSTCEYLISKNADLNLTTDYVGNSYHGYTALHWARANRDQVMIKILILAGAVDTPLNGYCLIHQAIQNGWVDIVTLLVDQNPVVINQLNDKGQSPLILAARGRHTSTCEYLISKNADLNLTTDCVGNSYHGYTALHWARANHDHVMIKILILAGAVDTPLNGYCLIHQAIQNGWVDIVTLLVDQNPVVINQLNDKGQSPLIHAARGGHTSTCEYLISKNADLNLTTDYVGSSYHGYTALHWARRYNNLAMIKTLIVAGAVDTPFSGCYLIHQAVEQDWIDIVKLLIDKYPALVNQTDNVGQTPLMFAVRTYAKLFGIWFGDSNRRLELVQYLVLEGADLNVVSSDGSTALDLAKEGAVRVIEDFLITAIACEAEKPKEKKVPTAFSSSTMVMFPKQVTIKTEQENHTSAIDDPWNW